MVIHYVCTFIDYECLPLDVLTEGVWSLFEDLQDPRLKKLKEALSETVFGSRASSTTKKYMYAFQRWRWWAEDKQGVTIFPIESHHFVLYLQHVGMTTNSKAAVEEAVNAASWVLQMAGLESTMQAPIIQATGAGLQRQLAKPKSKKEPITWDMLKQMADSLSKPPSLTESRLLAISLLAFSAFLCFDELVKIRCCDVKFEKDLMSIHISSSKTDQYRQGADVVVARGHSEICPVARLEEYYSIANLDPQSTEKLFHAITRSKNGEKLRKSGSISYTRLRELVLQKVQELGYDPKMYGLHSFRSGGASLAANEGVPDRLFKRHGRWRSDTAKDGYVKDALEDRLLVSKSLKL